MEQLLLQQAGEEAPHGICQSSCQTAHLAGWSRLVGSRDEGTGAGDGLYGL